LLEQVDEEQPKFQVLERNSQDLEQQKEILEVLLAIKEKETKTFSGFSRVGDVVSAFLRPLKDELIHEGRWETFIQGWEDDNAPFDGSNPQTSQIAENFEVLPFLTKAERDRADIVGKVVRVILWWM
jgi:hypothetical protein